MHPTWEQYIKQLLIDIKEENCNTIIEDCNTPLISMDRTSRQKLNKETVVLNDVLDQMDLTGYIQNIPSPNNGIHISFQVYMERCPEYLTC